MSGFARRLIRGVIRRIRPGAGDRAAALNARYDRETVEVMQRILRRDSNCVDVGCHAGRILKEILKVAPDGRHLAFEPIPEVFERLKAAFSSHANVEFHCVALSDARGEAAFQHVVTNPEYSGLRRRKYDRPDEEVMEIRVETDLLDRIAAEGVPIHFIKIDVEGAELQVLRGAARVISRWKPVIVFEHGLGGADCYGTRPEDIHDLLANVCGLRVSLMERFLSDEAPFGADEFRDQFRRGENFYFIAYP